MGQRELRTERQELAARRDRELEAVRDKYRPLLEEIDGRMARKRAEAKEKAKATPTPAMLRHLEPDDAPMRLCEGCHEPMLTATIANAQLVASTVVDFEVRKIEPLEVGASILRRMKTATHCCYCCKRGDGHSRMCTSANEQQLRLKERDEMNKIYEAME